MQNSHDIMAVLFLFLIGGISFRPTLFVKVQKDLQIKYYCTIVFLIITWHPYICTIDYANFSVPNKREAFSHRVKGYILDIER